jgi:hypothetical protein
VAAPPTDLVAGERLRRDVRLVTAAEAGAAQASAANYGLGMWWAGLSTPAKIWTVIGIVAVVGITAAAVDSDDDEDDASPF